MGGKTQAAFGTYTHEEDVVIHDSECMKLFKVPRVFIHTKSGIPREGHWQYNARAMERGAYAFHGNFKRMQKLITQREDQKAKRLAREELKRQRIQAFKDALEPEGLVRYATYSYPYWNYMDGLKTLEEAVTMCKITEWVIQFTEEGRAVNNAPYRVGAMYPPHLSDRMLEFTLMNYLSSLFIHHNTFDYRAIHTTGPAPPVFMHRMLDSIVINLRRIAFKHLPYY